MATKKKVKSLNLNSNTASKIEKYIVTGLEAVVPQIREIDNTIIELNKQRSHMKDMIINKVKPIKSKEEKKGHLFKTFIIESDDGVPANILFKNAFSKIPIDNLDAMQKSLGENFEELYEVKTQIALRRNAKFEELKKTLGKKFEDFFGETKQITHKKDFMEKRADLRNKVNKKVNDILDQYTKDCQSTPDLRMK